MRVVNNVPEGAAKNENNFGFGNEVIIRHSDGTYSQYAHLGPAQDERGNAIKDEKGNNGIVLQENDEVKAGEQIGAVGKTGNVPDKADPHLHFEVRVFGSGVSAKERTTIHPFYFLPNP
ncbi:M23 family metallopeptidase [Dongia sp.]|uniref:M23 family metallopeptidase n=1 Tax=Dongia sp. TaxID=1977262 RepID=UPI0035ADD5E3